MLDVAARQNWKRLKRTRERRKHKKERKNERKKGAFKLQFNARCVKPVTLYSNSRHIGVCIARMLSTSNIPALSGQPGAFNRIAIYVAEWRIASQPFKFILVFSQAALVFRNSAHGINQHNSCFHFLSFLSANAFTLNYPSNCQMGAFLCLVCIWIGGILDQSLSEINRFSRMGANALQIIMELIISIREHACFA